MLAGPRGRGLCLAVAHRLNPEVWSAWLHAAWHLDDRARRDDLVRALGRVDAGELWLWRDPLLLLDAVDETVSHAMYWQPPHDEDVVAVDPEVRHSLAPLAEALIAAPATAWWTTPLDLSALRYTSRFAPTETPTPPVLTGAADQLACWRQDTLADNRRAGTDRPADPDAPFSGRWWSTPAPAPLVTTTRPLAGLGSIALGWEEDSFGQGRAAVWPMHATQEPRVWEIAGPQDWTRLVTRYPLEITDARRHDWYRAAGRVGCWQIPDWSAVSTEWDAVHLTVAGYLTTATRALTITNESATVLAGWNPDQTWWLADILQVTTGQPELWSRGDEPETRWHRRP